MMMLSNAKHSLKSFHQAWGRAGRQVEAVDVQKAHYCVAATYRQISLLSVADYADKDTKTAMKPWDAADIAAWCAVPVSRTCGYTNLLMQE